MDVFLYIYFKFICFILYIIDKYVFRYLIFLCDVVEFSTRGFSCDITCLFKRPRVLFFFKSLAAYFFITITLFFYFQSG